MMLDTAMTSNNTCLCTNGSAWTCFWNSDYE